MLTTNYEKKDCPCKGCGERSPGCHGFCSYYKEWKEHHIARETNIRHKKFLEKEKNTYQIEAVRRVKSAAGHAIGCENARKYRRNHESSEMEKN